MGLFKPVPGAKYRADMRTKVVWEMFLELQIFKNETQGLRVAVMKFLVTLQDLYPAMDFLCKELDGFSFDVTKIFICFTDSICKS